MAKVMAQILKAWTSPVALAPKGLPQTASGGDFAEPSPDGAKIKGRARVGDEEG